MFHFIPNGWEIFEGVKNLHTFQTGPAFILQWLGDGESFNEEESLEGD